MEHDLERVELIDCAGKVSCAMTLLIDGRVHVAFDVWSVTVDPRTRDVRPQRHLSPTVWDEVLAFARQLGAWRDDVADEPRPRRPHRRRAAGRDRP